MTDDISFFQKMILMLIFGMFMYIFYGLNYSILLEINTTVFALTIFLLIYLSKHYNFFDFTISINDYKSDREYKNNILFLIISFTIVTMIFLSFASSLFLEFFHILFKFYQPKTCNSFCVFLSHL